MHDYNTQWKQIHDYGLGSVGPVEDKEVQSRKIITQLNISLGCLFMHVQENQAHKPSAIPPN